MVLRSLSASQSAKPAVISGYCDDSPGMHGTDKNCYCQQGEHGKMIGCDNDSCAYRWFHMECL